MSTDLVQQLATWLAATDIGLLELNGPSLRLRLRHDGPDVEVASDDDPADVLPESITAPATEQAATAVTAGSVGVFRHRHPLREDPVAHPGMAVEAGQPLGLLQVGALLLPVRAPRDGVVVAVCEDDGALVGYGTRLFELA
jgi:acetyl-CoA carboxylase biotin carboxyl carrier protein